MPLNLILHSRQPFSIRLGICQIYYILLKISSYKRYPIANLKLGEYHQDYRAAFLALVTISGQENKDAQFYKTPRRQERTKHLWYYKYMASSYTTMIAPTINQPPSLYSPTGGPYTPPDVAS